MTVSQDATSGEYVPANASEWTELLTGTGKSNPVGLWLGQEASGNLADSIGSYTLTAFNSPIYQQTVTGWSRKAFGTDDTVDAFYSTSIGDVSTTSYLVFAYVALTGAPAGNESLINLGQPTTDWRQVAVRTTPTYRAQGGGVTAVNGASDPSTTVHKVALLFNRATSTFSVITDQETITPTWVNPTTGGSYLSFGDGCSVARFLYACIFQEAWTAAEVSDLFDLLDTGPAPTLASGTTLAAMQSGSFTMKYTAAIEGYSKLLTDATAQQAIDAWYDETATSHYAQALPGLFVSMDNQQQLDWRKPFTRGGHLTLHIAPDADDTFGIDVFKRDAGDQTELETTANRTETDPDVRSTTGWASSGEAFIGTECFSYTGVNGTKFTGATRGKYAPFCCDSAGVASGVGFAEHHRVGTNSLEVLLQPLITEYARVWIGKWVGLWAHKYDASIPALNSKDNAQLVFAGRIESIADDPATGCTVVEVKHVLDCIGEASIGGRDQWSAKIRDTIVLQTGWRFTMSDLQTTTAPGNFPETADDLIVVASGAATEYEINYGNYTKAQVIEKINKWLLKAKADSDLSGNYTMSGRVIEDGSLHTAIRWSHGSVAATTNVSFEMSMPARVLEWFGWTSDGPGSSVSANGTIKSGIKTGSGEFHEISDNAVRRSIFTGFGGFLNSALIDDPEGTFVDQYAYLPSAVKPPTSGSHEWGIFLIEEQFLALGWYDGLLIQQLQLMPEQYGLGSVDLGDPGSLGGWSLPQLPSAPEFTVVRQIFVLEMPFGDALKRFIKSTGTSTYNDANWDTLGYGLGVGIPHDLCPNLLTSVDALPHADKPITVLVDRSLRLSTTLEGELILRRAFLRWNEEGVEFATWKSPNAGNTVATLEESNKAAPVGVMDHQRSVSVEDGGWAIPIQKIQYNRTLTASPNGDDGYRDSLVLIDKTAVDDLGGDGPSITINARGTLGDFAQTGSTVGSLAAGYLATMPLFSRPAPRLSRPIDQRYFEGLSIGDVVTISDEYARDPATGLRGMTRYGIITRHRYSLGGMMPNGTQPQPQGGEVDVFFLGIDRTAAYVPCSDVDDTQANGGYNAGTGALTVYAHRYSESSEAVDASHFAAGYKIRIVERDPSDPAAPLSWDRIIDTVSGNVITPTATLSSPAWDSAKKYRIVFDDYSDATAAQRLKTFQADDADYLVADTRNPFEYAVGGGDSSYTAWAAADAVELPPSSSYGDGVGYDVGHDVAVARLLNNLLSYKTARSSPVLLNDVQNTSGAISFSGHTYLCVLCFPIDLSGEILLNDVWRRLTVAPFYRSGNGSSAICRITVSRTPANGSDWFDVDRGSVYSEISFTTSSTTWQVPTPDDLVANVKGLDGAAWVYVEVNVNCETYGLAHCQEGEIRY